MGQRSTLHAHEAVFSLRRAAGHIDYQGFADKLGQNKSGSQYGSPVSRKQLGSFSSRRDIGRPSSSKSVQQMEREVRRRGDSSCPCVGRPSSALGCKWCQQGRGHPRRVPLAHAAAHAGR